MDTITRTINPKDQDWGYPFGVDGLLKLIDAAQHLAVSRYTVYELIKTGQLRSGKRSGKRYICRRSLNDHLAKMEC
jgi:excisionase family DNA binding protein